MASILLTVAGNVAGNAILPGIGGAILGGLGGMAGSRIDNALFGGDTAFKGPRLENLKVQDSSYGNGIPTLYGTVRVAGNVIWASDLIETISSESAGGKGGGGATVEKASYAVDCAIALGAGPIGGIRTIWADSKQIYSDGLWADGVLWDSEIYLGADGQARSPLMESALGADNVPAYRGLAYVVLHRLQLGNFGNRIPNLTFEVTAPEAGANPLWLGGVNPGIGARVSNTLCSQSVPPVASATRGGRILRAVVGGFLNEEPDSRFTAVEYDVSGDAPEEIARATSAAISGHYDIESLSLAADPPGAKIVFFMQYFAGAAVALALYDIAGAGFGAVCEDAHGSYEGGAQVAWLDDQRVAVWEKQAAGKGVRVYAVAGLSLTPVGSFDVWGASAATRHPLPFAHMAPLPDGLFILAGDSSGTPSTIYGRALQWQNNSLTVGAEQVVSASVYTGASAQNTLLSIGGGEMVLARATGATLRLISFIPSTGGVTITRDWTVITLTPNGQVSVNVSNGRLFFLHVAFSTGTFRYGEIGLEAGSFSLLLDTTAVGGDYFNPAGGYAGAHALGRSRYMVLNANVADLMTLVGLFEKASAAQDLADVVADILRRAGYAESDYDVSALSGLRVSGYAVQGPSPARNALAPLGEAFNFDLVESDGILKARVYSATADATVDATELRAVAEDGEPPPRVASRRAQELDLPREVVVSHLDPERDYQKGSQRARRAQGPAHASEELSIPLALSAEEAKALAENKLFRAWGEREALDISLSRAFVALDPGDVVSVESRLMRLTGLAASGGRIAAEGVALDAAALGGNPDALADSGQGGQRIAMEAVATTLHLMDLPLLREADDQPGYYVTASGRAGWKGAALYRSYDDTSWTQTARFTLPATCGVAITALPATRAEYPDRANSVTIGLLRGSVSGCTEAQWLAGANAALLGDEIIQFGAVGLNADGSVTLSDLLRGRRGTESAMNGHGVGERFVLLQNETARFLPLTLGDRDRTIHFRAPSTGQELDSLASAPFAPQLRTIAPLAPAHLAGARDDSGNLTVSWVRRARKNAEWVDGIDVPLDEDAALYDLDILDGANVVRQFQDLTSASAGYTAAMQAEDFGAAQAAVSVAAYQKSARYGRGAAAAGTV